MDEIRIRKGKRNSDLYVEADRKFDELPARFEKCDATHSKIDRIHNCGWFSKKRLKDVLPHKQAPHTLAVVSEPCE